MVESPFDLSSEESWLRWRDHKLAQAPARIEELVVEVGDPRKISDAEHGALLQRIRRANMAIYVSDLQQEGTDIARAVGERFGCYRLDHNRGAEEDAVTALTVREDSDHSFYIPYTNRGIHWHTDGYYNPLDRQDLSLLLHCVRPAGHGGENGLMDHEMAWLLLREAGAELIRALMEPDVMTIPAHVVEGRELRPERTGPVFMVTSDGTLHMRYTMRKRNVVWKDRDEVHAAREQLERIFLGSEPPVFRATLQSGWGLICNNVLHNRTPFNDTPEQKRLLYRARYYDRIQLTDPAAD